MGYSFTGNWVQNIAGSRQIDIKLSGRNLKLWADYSGVDPETNLGGASNSNRGIDFFNTPLTKAWVAYFVIHR